MAEVFNVCVVGAGYVGLATGACLTHLGHQVVCVDKDEERLRGLRSGPIPFFEPGLEALLSRSVREGRLSFATGPDGLAGLLGETDVVFMAVGTPQRADGFADLSNVGAVARGIGRALAEASPTADFSEVDPYRMMRTGPSHAPFVAESFLVV
jgi:UDPglucose 6-dehydrogenase